VVHREGLAAWHTGDRRTRRSTDLFGDRHGNQPVSADGLEGGTVIPAEQDAFTITRSLPHGHVAAALGTARKIGLDRILGRGSN
jgi:hypothetical protein